MTTYLGISCAFGLLCVCSCDLLSVLCVHLSLLVLGVIVLIPDYCLHFHFERSRIRITYRKVSSLPSYKVSKWHKHIDGIVTTCGEGASYVYIRDILPVCFRSILASLISSLTSCLCAMGWPEKICTTYDHTEHVVAYVTQVIIPNVPNNGPVTLCISNGHVRLFH